MQVLPAGPDALLVELPLPAEVPLLYADVRRDLTCADLVPGARVVDHDAREQARGDERHAAP